MKIVETLNPKIVVDSAPEAIQPRFDLNLDELAEIETDMAEAARQSFGDTVSAAWVTPSHPFANFMRTHEASYFPEVADSDPEYDQNQVYLALVDTRNGGGRIVHGASVMHTRDVIDEEGKIDPTKTGLYTVDSLIALGNFSKEDFFSFYEKSGIDIDKSIAVETNFKIGAGFEKFNGLGSADLAYLTLFNTLIDNDAPIGGTVVFATINSKQIHSLQRVGVDVEPLMGRDDFRTEEEEHGVYSMPVAILVNQNCSDIFCSKELAMAELIY